MDLRQLRYFVAVADRGHFGRAADDLHIVQPAVSQQVARLERELGLVLFDRSHRRVTLTADGRSFLPHARHVLDAADRAVRAAAELRAGTDGLLRVGSSEGLGERLEKILGAFRRQHPEAAVELIAATTPEKLAAVARGDFHAAFVRAPQVPRGVVVHPLWDEPLVLAIPAGRRPAGADVVDLGELADLPLAQAPRSANPGVFDLVTAACRNAGFTPIRGPRFSSVQDVLAGEVAAGTCWTVLYDTTTTGSPRGVAVARPRIPVVVPTALVVRDPQRALVADFLTAARAVSATHRPNETGLPGAGSESARR